MIKTIIFDIGRVLVGYDWDTHLMRLFNNDRALVDRLEDALFKHGIWDEVDRGVWSEEELIAGFLKYAPDLETEIRYFWNNAGGALWQYDFTKDWLRDLKKQGYQLLYLSNWSDHMRQQAAEQLDFLPLLDGGVFSYECNLIKPDRAIYERIAEIYNLTPAECVFLDDLEANVNAARECGFKGIQVTSHERAVEELQQVKKDSVGRP